MLLFSYKKQYFFLNHSIFIIRQTRNNSLVFSFANRVNGHMFLEISLFPTLLRGNISQTRATKMTITTTTILTSFFHISIFLFIFLFDFFFSRLDRHPCACAYSPLVCAYVRAYFISSFILYLSE